MKRFYCVVFVLAMVSAAFASGLFSDNVANQSLNVIGASHKAALPAAVNKQPVSSPASPVSVASQTQKTAPGNLNSSEVAPRASAADEFTVSSSKIQQTEYKLLIKNEINKNNQHLVLLERQMQTVEKRIQSLSKAFGLINVQLQQLKLRPAPQPKVVKVYVVPKGFWSNFSRYLATVPAYVLLAVIFILLFVIAIMLARRPQSSAPDDQETESDSPEQDTEQEYDFMATKEAVPAKLDLARAYVAMQDYEQAKLVLKEVLAQGTREQKQEAETILNSISGGK